MANVKIRYAVGVEFKEDVNADDEYRRLEKKAAELNGTARNALDTFRNGARKEFIFTLEQQAQSMHDTLMRSGLCRTIIYAEIKEPKVYSRQGDDDGVPNPC
jgi:hypothetical protein